MGTGPRSSACPARAAGGEKPTKRSMETSSAAASDTLGLDRSAHVACGVSGRQDGTVSGDHAARRHQTARAVRPAEISGAGHRDIHGDAQLSSAR